MGILVAKHYSSTLFAKQADHTYVECGTGGKAWGCWGGNTGGAILRTGNGSTLQADAIAGVDERAGITCYLINGVCHQAANRILFPAGILVSGERVRGYNVSESIFGPYGRPRSVFGRCSAPFNTYPNITGNLSQCLNTLTGTGVQTSQKPYTSHKTYITSVMKLYKQFFSSRNSDFKESENFQIKLFELMLKNKLGSSIFNTGITDHLIQHRRLLEKLQTNCEKNFSQKEINVEEFVSKINNLIIDYQNNIANTLTEKNYKTFLGLSRDDKIVLGDINIARESYKNLS